MAATLRLFNLAKGALGEGNAHLLGALVTTAIAQATLARQNAPFSDRRVSPSALGTVCCPWGPGAAGGSWRSSIRARDPSACRG